MFLRRTVTLKMKLLASAIQNLEIQLEKKCLKVKMSKDANYFERYRNRYSDKAAAVSSE